MPRPTNALIVDDEPHVRVFVRMLLREVGIADAWEAANGVEAIEQLNAHEPELLLLDVNLPRMSGLEVLRELKAAGWDLPVVMMTAESSMKTVKEAAELGACGYLLKQSPKEECLARLREILDELAAE
jgi:CheY-like chemotaxis protein